MRILDKTIFHRNITGRKAVMFGLASGVGAVITLGMTYALTEWAGFWYMASVVVASTVAITVKFVINALWVFNDKQNTK